MNQTRRTFFRSLALGIAPALFLPKLIKPCWRTSSTSAILASMSVYNEVDWVPQSPWTVLIKRGKWPANLGETINIMRFEFNEKGLYEPNTIQDLAPAR